MRNRFNLLVITSCFPSCSKMFEHKFTNGTSEKLFSLITLISGVNAGCFPACSNMFEHKFTNGTGVRCWVAGWGRDASKDLG